MSKRMWVLLIAGCLTLVSVGGVLIYREVEARKPPAILGNGPIVIADGVGGGVGGGDPWDDGERDPASISEVAVDPAKPDSVRDESGGMGESDELPPAYAQAGEGASEKPKSSPIPAKDGTGTAKSPKATSSSKDTSAAKDTSSSKAATPPMGDFGAVELMGKAYPVRIGVDEATLDKHIGWMESSAVPGDIGTCVLMGHRNSQFRVLKDIQRGDVIRVTTAEGTGYEYTVQSASVVQEGEALSFPAQEDRLLALVTCYPFYYTGHAPHRFVVIAKLR